MTSRRVPSQTFRATLHREWEADQCRAAGQKGRSNDRSRSFPRELLFLRSHRGRRCRSPRKRTCSPCSGPVNACFCRPWRRLHFHLPCRLRAAHHYLCYNGETPARLTYAAAIQSAEAFDLGLPLQPPGVARLNAWFWGGQTVELNRRRSAVTRKIRRRPARGPRAVPAAAVRCRHSWPCNAAPWPPRPGPGRCAGPSCAGTCSSGNPTS